MPFSIDLGLLLSLYVPHAFTTAVIVCNFERFKLFFYLTYDSFTLISHRNGVILLFFLCCSHVTNYQCQRGLNSNGFNEHKE